MIPGEIRVTAYSCEEKKKKNQPSTFYLQMKFFYGGDYI